MRYNLKYVTYYVIGIDVVFTRVRFKSFERGSFEPVTPCMPSLKFQE